MKDKEIMTLEKALFILRHGSAEGEHKYFEAITIIENELNRQKADINMLNNNISIAVATMSNSTKDAKAEAYKEFAEWLISKAGKDILKEMVGDN